MPKSNPSQSETVEWTKNLRAAIDPQKLEDVFKAAGASKITGQATEVLQETTAAQVAPFLVQGHYEAPTNAPEPNAKLVQAAEGSFKTSKLNDLFDSAGMDPEEGQQAVGREMARIAQFAVDFARAEGRPVCHNCAAIGAAQAAAQLGPVQVPN